MAGDDDADDPLTPIEWVVVAVITLVFFLLLPLGCVAGGVNEIQHFRGAIDTSAQCSPTSERCLRRQQGVVEDAPVGTELGVRYDDGRRHTGVDLEGEWDPPVGTRVVLERLRGEVVAVYDPATEHRYETSRWPSWEDAVLGVVLIAGGVLVLALTVYVLCAALVISLRARWRVRAGRA